MFDWQRIVARGVLFIRVSVNRWAHEEMNMHVYVYMYVHISMWRARSKISTCGCSYSYRLVDYPCIISRIRDYVKIYQAHLIATRFQAPSRYGSYQYSQQYSQARSHGGFLSAGLWDCALAWLWDWSYQLDSMDFFGRMGIFLDARSNPSNRSSRKLWRSSRFDSGKGGSLMVCCDLTYRNSWTLHDFAIHVWDFLLVFPQTSILFPVQEVNHRSKHWFQEKSGQVSSAGLALPTTSWGGLCWFASRPRMIAQQQKAVALGELKKKQAGTWDPGESAWKWCHFPLDNGNFRRENMVPPT